MVLHGTAKGATGAPAVDSEKQQVTSRIPSYEPGGREFESLRARQIKRGRNAGPFLFGLFRRGWVAHPCAFALRASHRQFKIAPGDFVELPTKR